MVRYEPVEMSSPNVLTVQNRCDRENLYIKFNFNKERISESSFIEWASVEERVVS